MAWDWLKDNNDEPNEFKPIDARGLLDGKEYHDYWATKLHNGLANVPKSLLGAVESIPAMAARTRPVVMQELENDLDGTDLMDSDADKAALSDVESQIKGTTAPIWEGARLGVKSVKDALPDANWESNVDESQLSYPKKIGGMIVENAPLMAAQLAASIINPALGVGLMAGSIAGDAYNDLTEKGVDPLTAGQAGWLDAAAQAPLEGVGEMGWLKAFRELGTEGAAKLMGKAFVKEGLTEAVQEFPDETIPYIAEHGSLDGFDWSQLASNAVDAGVVGGIYGGGFAGIGRAINGKADEQESTGDDSASTALALVDANATSDNAGENNATASDVGNSGVARDADGTVTIDAANIASPAMHAMNRIVNELGISPTAASGIVGGLMHESGGDTTDISTTAKNPTSGAYGIAQWLGSRYDDLVAFAEENNADPNDLDTQISFIIHELKGKESGALQEILKAQTPDEAGRLADQFYERSEGTDEIRNRKASNAQKIYDMFMNGGADPSATHNGSKNNSVPNPKSAEDFLKDLEETLPADTDEDVEKLNAIRKAIQGKNKKAQEELAAQYGWGENTPEAAQDVSNGVAQENVQAGNPDASKPVNSPSKAEAISKNPKQTNITAAPTIEAKPQAGNSEANTLSTVRTGSPRNGGTNLPTAPRAQAPINGTSPVAPSAQGASLPVAPTPLQLPSANTTGKSGSHAQVPQAKIEKARSNQKLKELVKQAFVDGDKDALARLNAMQINPDVLEAVKNDVLGAHQQPLSLPASPVPAKGTAVGTTAPIALPPAKAPGTATAATGTPVSANATGESTHGAESNAKSDISEKENNHENTKKNQPVHSTEENKNDNAKPEQSKPSEGKDGKTPEIKNPVKKAPSKETPSSGKKEEPQKTEQKQDDKVVARNSAADNDARDAAQTAKEIGNIDAKASNKAKTFLRKINKCLVQHRAGSSTSAETIDRIRESLHGKSFANLPEAVKAKLNEYAEKKIEELKAFDKEHPWAEKEATDYEDSQFDDAKDMIDRIVKMLDNGVMTLDEAIERANKVAGELKDMAFADTGTSVSHAADRAMDYFNQKIGDESTRVPKAEQPKDKSKQGKAVEDKSPVEEKPKESEKNGASAENLAEESGNAKPDLDITTDKSAEASKILTDGKKEIDDVFDRFVKGNTNGGGNRIRSRKEIQAIVNKIVEDYMNKFGYDEIERTLARAGSKEIEEFVNYAKSKIDEIKNYKAEPKEEKPSSVDDAPWLPSQSNPVVKVWENALYTIVRAVEKGNMPLRSIFTQFSLFEAEVAKITDKELKSAIADIVNNYKYKALQTFFANHSELTRSTSAKEVELSPTEIAERAKQKETKRTIEEDQKALELLGKDLYETAYKPIVDYLRIIGRKSRSQAFESAVLYSKLIDSFQKNYGIRIENPALIIKRGKHSTTDQFGVKTTIVGSYNPGAHVFRLTTSSDGLTFMHEATHMYMAMLRRFSSLTDSEVKLYFGEDVARAKKAIEQIRKDLKHIEEWAKYSKEHLAEYDATDLQIEFRLHALEAEGGTDFGELIWREERIARGMERYLGEGIAPSKELEGIFAKFKQWFIDAYQSLVRISRKPLPEDVRKFYDSMIAGDRGYFENMAKKEKGVKSSTVRTDDGKEFKVSYKIVPAETLIASNTADFGKNENYPANLQPRDRDRVSMKEQVDDMARNLRPEDLAESRSVNQGAPLVNQDNVVENGNGRTMAITRAYTTDGDAYKTSSQKYKQYLMEHAEEYGYTREEVEAMQNPVLVRQRDASSDSLQDSIIHSTEGGMKMSASQQAKVDAEKISPKTLSLYDYDGTGDLTKRSNNDFAVSALNEIADKSERDVVFNKDGTPSKAGIERVKSALAAYAYGDNSLLERISESTDTEDQNIVKAFSAAAPQVAAIKAKLNKGDVSKDYDLPKLLSDVLDFYFKCKNDGKSIKFALNETSLFGDNQSIASISGKNLARFIADNIRRPKAISDALVRMTKYIDGANEPGAALFSGSKMGLDEIIRTSVGLNTSKFIPASKPNARKYKHTIQPKENTWNSMPATQRKACIKLMDANGGHYDTKTKSFGFTDEKSRDAALNVLEAYLSADSKASAKIAIIPEMKVINKFSVKTPYQKMVENITPIASDDLTAREQAIVDFAKKMGLQVQFFEGDPNLHGFHADGTNVVFLNRHSAMDLNQTFWHETFHWMRESNPDLYNQMVKEVFGDEVSEKQLADYAASIGRTDMSKELTIEEMLADAMWDASKRGSFFEKLGIEHPSLCAKIIKWIKNLYEDFKAHFHNPRAGLTNTQIKRMSNTLSSIAEKLVDGDGNKLFSVDEKGNIKETAAGKIAVSGEAKVEAGQDGSGQKYRVTNRNIVASDPVRIVDITDAKRIRVKDGKNTKQADALVDSLLGKTFRFIGGEGFVAERDDNAVKGIENPNIRGQIIHSHATLSKIYNDKVRGKALGKLEELLRNGVYIDKHPDSAHGTKTKYIEIFVPVRDGDGLHVFKISARERGDSASVYEIGNALFYNVKKEGDLTMLPSEGYEKTASNKSPSMITIAEMLNGIKDRNNVPYVVNGKLNYDDNIFLTKNMLSSEPATSHSAEDLRAQTLSAFPNAQNIEPHDNGVSFDLPNGSHVEINFTDDTISVDRAKAQKDYGGTLKGNEKASGKIETVGKDALITLTMDSPDETVSHEAMHLAWNLLTDRERSALLRTYGSEEGAAEGVREWKIRRKMKQGTIAGKIMQKISDMAHKLLSLFSENDQHVFQKLESGEIWERGNENNTAARNVKYKMNPINEAEKYLKSHKNFGEKAGSYIDRTFRPDLAKAKANANISVNETKKKKGWGAVDTALNNTVRSPSRIKSPKTSYIWGLADTAQRELQELRGKWTHSFAGAIKNLNSKEKERYTDILWEEDMKQHVFSDKELRDAGVSEKIIKAHQKTRSLLSRIYTAVNAVYTRERIENFTYKTRKEAEEAKKELAKRPHTFVMHDIRETVKDGEPAFQVSIKTGGYREVHSVVTAEEMKKLDTDKDVYIKSRKQLDDGSFKVSYLAYNKPLANMEGYMPHIFHGVLIVKKYVDEDGNTQSKVVGSAESIDKAVVKADAMQKEEGGEFIIAPKEFSSEGEIENPLLLGDMDYFKLMENLRKGASLTLDEAREMTHATMKGRHVYYGVKKHRKGAEGFEKNAIWVIQHHIDSSSRYVALDPFKQKAISFFERAFGDYDKDWTGEAAFCKGYIDSVLGKPSRLETLANDFLRLFPWFKNEARPARRMAGNLTGLTGVLKLGASVASGFVNTLQLFNCVGYVGARKTAVGLKRALHPNATDKKILVASGVSEESGLALDSIGHVKAEGTALSKAGNVVNRVNDFLMKPFTFAEKTIRKATILAAYYKAIEDGLSKGEAIQYARDINRKVNFDYSVADAPRIFRALQGTVIGDMALQFQKYGVKEMEVISDFLPFLGSATTKQKLEFFIPYLLVSGIWNAFPFEDALLSLLKLLGFGDPEKEAKRAMMEWAGNNPDRKALVNVANYGAGSLAGVDISQRVGLKGAAPETSNIMTGGPLGSTTVQLAKAVLNGDTNGAMKAISPAAGNIYGAVAGYNTDSKGRKTVDYDSHDRIARGLGFRTIKEANATDAQSIVYNYKEQKKNDRAKAKSEYLKDPSSSNRQKLKEMGYSAKEIKALKDDKKSTRVERSQTGLSKEDKKKLKAVFDYVQ